MGELFHIRGELHPRIGGGGGVIFFYVYPPQTSPFGMKNQLIDVA